MVTGLGDESQDSFILRKDSENTEKHSVLSNEGFLCENGNLC